MSRDDLTEVFGEDLAKNVESKIAERREERNSVTDAQMKEICAMAINEGKFQDGDPQFTFTTENNVNHNVLLMQVPDPNNGTVWEYLDEPWDGAASLPLDYLGSWMNITFPDKNKLADADLDPGAWFILVGEINTYNAQDGTEKESLLAREIVSIFDARELASGQLEDEGFAQEEEKTTQEDTDPVEEQEPEPPETEPEEVKEDETVDEAEEEDDDDSGGLGSLLGGNDDEEEDEEPESDVDYDEVEGVVETLADKDEQVWEVDVHDASDDRSDKLTKIVAKQIEEDDVEAVRDVVGEVIESHGEDDEEDDLEDSLF